MDTRVLPCCGSHPAPTVLECQLAATLSASCPSADVARPVSDWAGGQDGCRIKIVRSQDTRDCRQTARLAFSDHAMDRTVPLTTDAFGDRASRW